MKSFLVSLLLILASVGMSAQSTKLRGRVTDADTGEGIPFAGVFLKGTTIGVTSDLDGYYTLETRENSTDILVCQLLGYDSQEKRIKSGQFSNVNFTLKLSGNELSSVVIKADNHKVKRLLANIDANRQRNSPELKPHYSCDLYTKMELDLTNAEEQLSGKKFMRQMEFIFDYMDTSTVSGVPYLPTMISESIVKRFHSCNPDKNSETIVANRISGINPENNLLTQFTGSMHLQSDFYKPFVNSFGVEFPSPIQSGGLLYYNYFIIDSLQVDGRKTYLIRYHPKNGISSPALDGEMQIDAYDFAIRSIHAKMKHGGNVNWLRDIVMDVEYRKLPDSSWFYSRDNLYADFSIALSDSSKMISVLGRREQNFKEPSYKAITNKSLKKVEVAGNSNSMDEEYWASVRPYELTQKEKDIYKMVEDIKDLPLYQTVYDIINTLVTGYWDIGKIGIGPYAKIFSFNNLEGFRTRLGIHTSKDFSTKHRWTAYIAYGFGDHSWKGGLGYERMFGKDPTRKLTLEASHDLFQLGRSNSNFTDANILSSVLGKGNAQKLCPLQSFSARYEHEFNINFNFQADIALRRYYSNRFVPMMMSDSSPVHSIATNEIHLSARFSKEETVNRGYFIKTYVHTLHPVLTLDLTGSVKGIRPGDVAFLKPEISVDWKFRIPPLGFSKMKFNAGTIVGEVPYPLLHLHPGNGTYILDRSAFSCMDFFEFASDSWADLFWNHNFYGFFLGKIPLISKLNLREEFSMKLAWGNLSDRNNALKNPAIMEFPLGMKTLGKVPYVELGAGISNIFKIFRVDCFWRLTHKEGARQLFCVTAGLEIRF